MTMVPALLALALTSNAYIWALAVFVNGAGYFAVLEVSSFQLETIKDFKPKIAVILNLTPNHLDRYNNIGEYLDAKKRIFMNQDENDFLILP